jgi:hypothetical protein
LLSSAGDGAGDGLVTPTLGDGAGAVREEEGATAGTGAARRRCPFLSQCDSTALTAGTASAASTNRDSKTPRVPDRAIGAFYAQLRPHKNAAEAPEFLIEKLAAYEWKLIDEQRTDRRSTCHTSLEYIQGRGFNV